MKKLLIIVALLWVTSAFAQTTFVIPPGQSLDMQIVVDLDGTTRLIVGSVGTVIPPPPPPPNPLTAIRCASSLDLIGQLSQSTPNGIIDWCLEITGGLKAEPTSYHVVNESTSIWHGPYNGNNWMVVRRGNRFYFEYWPSSHFTITVTYPDGTSDSAYVP